MAFSFENALVSLTIVKTSFGDNSAISATVPTVLGGRLGTLDEEKQSSYSLMWQMF